MKKKLLLFLAPALLLSLVGCGKKTSTPNSTVNPPLSTTSPKDDTSTTPAPDNLTYTIPTDLAQMHEAVAKAKNTDYVGFIAKIVGVQQYSNNKQFYLQNGKYGYCVNNAPIELDFKVGDVVEVYGRGAGKAYPAINYGTDNLGKITAYSGETVTADPLSWASSILMSESSGAAVTGSGMVTAVGKSDVTVAIGSDSVTLSWMTNTVGGTAVATKMAGVSIGQDVTFSGVFYDGTANTKISILQDSDIELGKVNKQAWPGTLSQIDVGGITGQVNSGNTLALTGTAQYVAADVSGRYEKGYVVGAKLTKHASLPDLKSVTAKVTLPAFDGGTPTVVEYTNAQLVEKKILVSDGLEFYFNLTDKYKNTAIPIEVNWASYVETQTVTLSFGAITYEATPELLEGTPSLVETAGLTGTVTGNNLAIGSAETPETIAWVADKGNVVNVKVTAPANYVAAETTVAKHKNGSTEEAVAWSTLNPASDAITLELPLEKATDSYIIDIVWKTGAIAQHIKVTLVEGTILEANPDAPAETTLTLVIGTVLNGKANETKVSNFPTGDDNISIVTGVYSGTDTNTGKYYTSSGGTWRFYCSSTEKSTITISSSTGKTIVSVKINFTGGFTYNDAALTSNKAMPINASSAELKCTAKAQIKSIEVIYK